MERSPFIYRAVRHLIRIALRFYFRRIELTGLDNIPRDGAVLFCGNHQNSLVDAMMIICFSGRDVRFAAADILFENPILRFFLTRLQVVPLRRKQDHVGKDVDNSSAFDALFEVLGRGGAMGIFPEGLSHRESDLSQFKTGPARLAFGTKAENPDLPVYIVPCGLHYSNPNRFRTSVLVRYGIPLEITHDKLSEWNVQERQTVRSQTDELEAEIRELTVTADDWDTIHLLDAARRLYQPARISMAERVALAHRFNSVYPLVRSESDIEAFLERIRRYTELIGDLHLTDEDIRSFSHPGKRIWAAAKLSVVTALLTPLAILGAPVHAPLLLVVRWGGRRFSPREDTVATTKVVAGLLLCMIVYGLIASGLFYFWDFKVALWGTLALPIAGWAFVAWLYRVRSLLKISRLTMTALVVGRGLLARLVAERKALVEQVDGLVSRYIPSDMERLFPPVKERGSSSAHTESAQDTAEQNTSD